MISISVLPLLSFCLPLYLFPSLSIHLLSFLYFHSAPSPVLQYFIVPLLVFGCLADLVSPLIHHLKLHPLHLLSSSFPPLIPPSSVSPPITLNASDSRASHSEGGRGRRRGGDAGAGGRQIAVKSLRVDSYGKGQLTPLYIERGSGDSGGVVERRQRQCKRGRERAKEER